MREGVSVSSYAAIIRTCIKLCLICLLAVTEVKSTCLVLHWTSVRTIVQISLKSGCVMSVASAYNIIQVDVNIGASKFSSAPLFPLHWIMFAVDF